MSVNAAKGVGARRALSPVFDIGGMTMPRLEIGKIVNTHGLKGEVKVLPWCDDAAVFTTLKTIATAWDIFEIESARPHKNAVIIKFLNINTIDAADKLRNEILYVEKEQLGALAPNTYYVADIIGLEVYENGNRIGRVKDCFPTGSNDVYVVDDNGAERLIPALSHVIKKIDIKGRRIDINLPKGV